MEYVGRLLEESQGRAFKVFFQVILHFMFIARYLGIGPIFEISFEFQLTMSSKILNQIIPTIDVKTLLKPGGRTQRSD